MNTVESFLTISPFNETEECAKFTISDPSKVFMFSNIASVGREYTFSTWIKSANDSGAISIVIGGKEFIATTTDWTRCEVTFTASSRSIPLRFSDVGICYLYKSKLEIGNKVTDWTPAPEDIDRAISSETGAVRGEILEQSSSILNACGELIASASATYVKTDEYGDFKEYAESQFKVTPESIGIAFNSASERIDTVDGEWQTFKDTFSKYIKFTSETAITIGSGDSAITLEIDNETGIIFKKNGEPFGRWDGNDFYTGNIVVEVEERAQLGNFAFVPRSDGSLSFLKVGG